MTDQPYYVYPTVTDNHLRAIGHIAVQWAELEETFNLAIGYAAWHLKETNLKIESSSPFVQKLRKWQEFGFRRFPTSREELEQLGDAAANLHGFRSAIIHGCWTTGGYKPPHDLSSLTVSKGFITKPERQYVRKLTPEKLESRAAQISQLHGKLTEFHFAVDWFHFSRREPSQDKP